MSEWQTKFDGKTDKTISLGGDGNPTQIVGYFVGSKTTPDKGYGEGKLHIFKTQEGYVGVWGKTRLNNLLTEDHKGQMCRVTFTGMIPPPPGKKGRRPSYGFKLDYKANDTIDVSGVSLNSGEAESHEDYELNDVVSDDSASEDFSFDEAPPVVKVAAPARPAAPANAARRAEVENLLKRR